MTPEHWQAVLSRLGTGAPDDLDADLGPKDAPRRGAGLSVWREGATPPSALLWDRPEADATYIGVRTDGDLGGAEVALALRLAAAALERGVNPIVLAAGDGALPFERFGFRVERFVGDNPADRAAWEAEMTAFWNLALIIDAKDVAALG